MYCETTIEIAGESRTFRHKPVGIREALGLFDAAERGDGAVTRVALALLESHVEGDEWAAIPFPAAIRLAMRMTSADPLPSAT